MNAPATLEARKALTSVMEEHSHEREEKQFTGTALRLVKLLGIGCTQVEAARACGVDESLVSQYMASQNFQEAVNKEVKKNFAHQSAIDENYNEVERTLSERLKKVSEYTFDPDKILRTLKFVNEAKRKLAPALTPGGLGVGGNGGNGGIHIHPVILMLPSTVSREFVVNPNNEVVGIGDQTLSTISTKELQSIAEQHKTKQLEKHNGSRSTDPWSDL